MILAHTIEAMVGEKPARVHCNTCGSQHTYKAQKPATSAKSAASPRKGRSSKYETLLSGKNVETAKAYSTTQSYSPGDVVKHPTFGVGVATAVRDETKVEFLFEGGPKLLVHGR
jgi:hypothetical protein